MCRVFSAWDVPPLVGLPTSCKPFHQHTSDLKQEMHIVAFQDVHKRWLNLINSTELK